jgi:hypothetical protein
LATAWGRRGPPPLPRERNPLQRDEHEEHRNACRKEQRRCFKKKTHTHTHTQTKPDSERETR